MSRTRGRVAAGRSWTRSRGERVLAAVPLARRSLHELLRVEFVDRSIVVAAQALLALVPLIVVVATVLPREVVDLALGRLQSVTGLEAGREAVGVGSTTSAQVGVVGVVITVLSASSFARALMRAYEVVWDLPHRTGLRGRRRCLGWLLLWLVALEGLALTRRVAAGADVGLVVVPLFLGLLQLVLVCALWWWTLHVLLAGRVAWRRLVVPAVLTGTAVALYVNGSSVVMPRYASSSVEQLGGFGLVLALAAWLVGASGVLVVAAVLGRAVAEDRTVAAWWSRTAGRLR